MDLKHAVKQIMSRIDMPETKTQFNYEDINQWLNIKSGYDVMWAYDKLSERLTEEHSIYLELEKNCITAIKNP